MQEMFAVVHYSENGTNDREKEELTYMRFVDLLHDCEGDSLFYISKIFNCTYLIVYRWK